MGLKHIRWMVAWIAIILLSGCSIENPEIEKIGAFKFKGLKNSKLCFSVEVILRNPNAFGFKIKKTDLSIFSSSDELLGEITLDKSVRIKRKTSQTYQLDLTADLTDGAIIKMVRMSAKSNPEIKLKGKVTGTFLGLPRSRTIEQNYPLDKTFLRSIKLF